MEAREELLRRNTLPWRKYGELYCGYGILDAKDEFVMRHDICRLTSDLADLLCEAVNQQYKEQHDAD